jgi:hypothetical protein
MIAYVLAYICVIAPFAAPFALITASIAEDSKYCLGLSLATFVVASIIISYALS